MEGWGSGARTLGEAENVVDEEEHVLSLVVTEVLGDGEAGKGDTGTRTRGLVHLSEDERGLRLVVGELDDTSLDHLVVEVWPDFSESVRATSFMHTRPLTVTLTGALSDTGENGVSSVGLGDVVDELLDEDGLADSGSTEESDLSTTRVRGEEVDDLDSGLEDLGRGRLVDELGRVGVDRAHGDTDDGTTLVNGLTDDVHDATEAGGADGDEDGRASVDDGLATDETLGSWRARRKGTGKKIRRPWATRRSQGRTVHGDGADRVLSQVHRDLEDEAVLEALDLERVEDGGEVIRVELDLHVATQQTSAASETRRRGPVEAPEPGRAPRWDGASEQVHVRRRRLQ